VVLGDADMLFTLIPPGAFIAGGFTRYDSLAKLHPVPIKRRTLSGWADRIVPMPYAYYMTVSPVTQEQWLAVTGENPSNFQQVKEHLEHPVERVSWDDVKTVFLPKLAESVKLDANLRFDLPDEMEWEYACKAGSGTFFHFGNRATLKLLNYNGLSMLDNVFHPNKSPKNISMTTPPGMYPANVWGLYDMHGNVREWCADSNDNAPKPVPLPQAIPQKMVRGGSFNDFWEMCVAYESNPFTASSSDPLTGFRLIIWSFAN
jgi:formylglycine-generating enzyme required for sulfatase activity